MTSSILLVKKSRHVAQLWQDALAQKGYVVLAYMANECEVLEAVREHEPTILLIDASFASNQGFEIARQARQMQPSLRSIVCLPVKAVHYSAAVQTDASGYLPDDLEDPNEVFACLDSIEQGYRYISPAFHRAIYLPGRHDNRSIDVLTSRQRQILQLVAEGYTSRQIGHALGIAQSTVQNHKEHISKLIGLKGVYQLKIFAGSVAQFL